MKPEERIKELEAALEADANDLWRVTNAIKKEIQARDWIMEGRGCYAWDDDRYRDETRFAFEAVLKLIAEVQHPAQKRFHNTFNKTVSHDPELKEGDLEILQDIAIKESTRKRLNYDTKRRHKKVEVS